MSLLLYLMRHGTAEDSAASGRDADRALTAAGCAAVRRVALALSATPGRPVGRIIASPLLRAQQTAEIVRDVLSPHVEIESDEDLSPDDSAYDLAVRLSTMTCDTLLVTHMPNIEMVARAIVSPQHAAAPAHCPQGILTRMPSGFRTATVVAFHVEGRPPPYRLALAVDPSALPAG